MDVLVVGCVCWVAHCWFLGVGIVHCGNVRMGSLRGDGEVGGVDGL